MALLLNCRFSRSLATFARVYSFKRHTNAYRRRTFCEIRNLSRNVSTSLSNCSNNTDNALQDDKLDRSLRRLDQEVRRAGRVSKKELQEALEKLKFSSSATSTQSLLLIRCCGNLLPEEPSDVRTQIVDGLWKMLHNLGVPIDVSHYNALLQVYLENEHPFSPTEFLRDIENKGIEPNRVTYQRLVERYCQEGDIEGATHILEFMRAKQLPVNEYIFNSLIFGHSQAGDMKSATDILSVMKQTGLEPSPETYKTLLCGFSKHGDIESLRSTLELCSKEDMLLTDQYYMDIIYALAVNGHSQYVDEIIGKFHRSAGFNHDAINLILKLTNKKKYTEAKKILLSMSPGTRDGHTLPSGSFFIRQLVKANCPIQETLAVCEELQQKGLNDRSLYVATESSLLFHGNVENTFVLFSALQKQGSPIRQHYFWPLIISCGKAGDTEGLLDILKAMSEKFDLQVQGETLRDYAVPWLHKLCSKNTQSVISMLQSAKIPLELAAVSLVHHLLLENNIADALQIVDEFHVTHITGLLRGPLLQAYQHSKDTKSFAGMLFALYKGTEKVGTARVNSSFADELGPVLDSHEMVGQVLLDLVSDLRRISTSELEALLEILYRKGINISNSTAERLVEKMGSELVTAEISNLLEKLTSKIAAPRQEYKQLSRRIFWNENRVDSPQNVKKQLLSSYCRDRNLEKTYALQKELLNDGVVINPLMTVQLLDLYISYEDIEKALDIFKWSQNRLHDFVLNRTRVVKLATVLVKNNDIEGAINLLNEHSQSQKTEELTFTLSSACRSMLSHLANQGDVTNVKVMFDCLLKNNYIDINNAILGPLIKVHLVRNDMDGAVRQFEELCHMYHCTPMKNELTCKLIDDEDAVLLQRLTDLSTKVHGEVNSLYDLVFAFVECGRIRQARKILETPGLLSRPQRIQIACKHYSQEGKVSYLEGLLEATKSLSHIDSSDIYQHLLMTYCKKNDAENALGLWVKMQEENLQPTDEFLIVLGNFLKEKDLPIPFVPPEGKVISKSDESASTELLKTEEFLLSLKKDKFEEAQELFMRMDEGLKLKISHDHIISLLDGLLQSGKHEDVRKLLLHIFQLKLYPGNRKLRNVIEQISLNGDFLTLDLIDAHLNENLKRSISYDNNLCRAYVVAGKAPEYLELLEKKIDNATSHDVSDLKAKFPRTAILLLLKEHADLHSQYQRICEKYQKLDIIIPFNMLWIFHAMEHQYKNADDIWNKYLFTSQFVKYNTLSLFARNHEDLDLAKYVVNKLNQSVLQSTSKKLAYSCVIEILLSRGKIEEVREYLKESQSVFSYDNLSPEVQQKLENAAEKQGISLKSF